MREFIRRPFIIPPVEQPQKRRSPKTVVSNIECEADQSIELVLAERNSNVAVNFVFRSAEVIAEYRFRSRFAYSIRAPFLSISRGYGSRMDFVPIPDSSVRSGFVRIVTRNGIEILSRLKRADQIATSSHSVRPTEARESVGVLLGWIACSTGEPVISQTFLHRTRR